MPAPRTAFLIGLALAAPAFAEAPQVVTDIPPVHSLVAQVMQGVGEPELLLDRGASAHDYQLRPSQAAALASADLVFWIGPEMTPWLERALAANSGGERPIALLALPGVTLRHFAEDDDHAEEEEHGHESGEEAHSHSGVDPHAWLEPRNAAVWVDAIAAELAARDPDNAATYAANAQMAKAAIESTDAAAAAALAKAGAAPIAVFHDAYGYFAAHYGLTVAGALAEGDAAMPGAARLSAMRQTLADQGVACLFPEAGHDTRLSETLAEGTGIRLGASLDPAGSLIEPGPDLYARLLLGLADEIATCLEGAGRG